MSKDCECPKEIGGFVAAHGTRITLYCTVLACVEYDLGIGHKTLQI